MKRIFNLTDVPTQALKAAGLVNTRIKVSGVTVSPGESQPVPPGGMRADAARYLAVSAIHVGSAPPVGYKPAAERDTDPERKVLPVRREVTVEDTVQIEISGSEDAEEDIED